MKTLFGLMMGMTMLSLSLHAGSPSTTTKEVTTKKTTRTQYDTDWEKDPQTQYDQNWEKQKMESTGQQPGFEKQPQTYKSIKKTKKVKTY